MLLIATPKSASTSISEYLACRFGMNDRQILHFIPKVPSNSKLKKYVKLKNILSKRSPELSKLHSDAVEVPLFIYNRMCRSRKIIFKQHFLKPGKGSVKADIFLYEKPDRVILSYEKLGRSGLIDISKVDMDALYIELDLFNKKWFEASRIQISRSDFLRNYVDISRLIGETFNIKLNDECTLKHRRNSENL